MDTENNKIIAEFMGFEIKNKINYIPSSLPNCMKKAEHLKVDKSENLPFHNDWNWLMEVVEKIESLLPDDSFVTIEYRSCYIPIYDDEQPFGIECRENTKIQAVYNACLEFIKWYNENKANFGAKKNKTVENNGNFNNKHTKTV